MRDKAGVMLICFGILPKMTPFCTIPADSRIFSLLRTMTGHFGAPPNFWFVASFTPPPIAASLKAILFRDGLCDIACLTAVLVFALAPTFKWMLAARWTGLHMTVRLVRHPALTSTRCGPAGGNPLPEPRRLPPSWNLRCQARCADKPK